DQAPWKILPFYFGFDAFAGANHRDDEHLGPPDPVTDVPSVEPGVITGPAVERSEFAPRVVVPLRWGPWLGLTTSYTVRVTSYGAQIQDGSVVDQPLVRTTG